MTTNEMKVKSECSGKWVEPYWKGLIEKENLPVSPRLKRKRLGSKTEVETSFIEDQSHQLDETCYQYKEPIFHQYEYMDDISNEEHVRQALSVNLFENLNSITVLREPRERLDVEKYEDDIERKCSKTHTLRNFLLWIFYARDLGIWLTIIHSMGYSQRTTKTGSLRDPMMNLVLWRFPQR
ncbi:2152_t:CDS:2 [Funneliformis caledonium]|uniref:2152_t:CDS:1 n=1 Tax=Funneliformis caledonium TaxID=1117310 RepID=A0A9N9C0T8_9GLOM|nr:2152_t:CDS:2 [Funneliformis caledonium]